MTVESDEGKAGRRAGPTKGGDGSGTVLLRLAPVGLLLALIATMGWLLLRIDSDERDQHRDELIRDALWVEQTLEFQLSSQQARLSRLAVDMAAEDFDQARFIAQGKELSQINSEIKRLVWLDANFQAIAEFPGRTAGDGEAINVPVEVLRSTARLAPKGAFTPPFLRRKNDCAVAFVTKVEKPDRPGYLVALFSVEAMLTQYVPWWIAERRAVMVTDYAGTLMAKRSQIEPDEAAPSHSVEIGPPLQQTMLTLKSFRQRQSLWQNGLVATMVVLGLLAAAGFFARQRQMWRRKAAETALDEEHSFRKAMENSLLVGIRARDMSGRLLYVNQAFCRMVGYSSEELVGLDAPMPYWAPDQLDHTRRVHDAVLAGQAIGHGLELKFRRRDGTMIDVLIYEAPLVDGQGRQRGWMGSVLDISDRKRAEELARTQSERMQHTARLVTMGEMASLLAHDLNQPLAAISSYTAGLQNIYAASEFKRPDIEAALSAVGASAERAGEIVRRVQHFVKKSEARMEDIDVGELVRETLAFLEPESRKASLQPELARSPLLPKVRADRVLIQQVLVNLIRNGLESMSGTNPNDRRLAIEVIGCGAEDVKSVEVSVIDGGPGVSSNLISQLFTPFISTKPSGMGMGLSISRSIIELHGGHIRYESGQNNGARFTFSLPALEGAGHE